MSSSFKVHDKHTSINLLGWINNRLPGTSEPEIHSSAPSVQNWEHWFKNECFGYACFYFPSAYCRSQESIFTCTQWFLSQCCNSPTQPHMQSLRKTCISQLSSCQPPGFQQQEQLYDVHLTSMHFFMPFISVCPEATHNMHPWGEKKISTCIYTRLHYSDYSLVIFSLAL